MQLRLTKEGRAVRNTLLKAALWTTCATIVLRGCIGALSDVGRRSTGQPSEAVAQPAPAQEPDPYAAWKDAPFGTTLTGPWHNTSGQTYIVYINGVRTIVLNGETVTISGVVVYDRRYKCKALRLESEDDSGKPKRIYTFLSKPTPASFWDCTPDE
jgi:hypothetical protein